MLLVVSCFVFLCVSFVVLGFCMYIPLPLIYFMSQFVLLLTSIIYFLCFLFLLCFPLLPLLVFVGRRFNTLLVCKAQCWRNWNCFQFPVSVSSACKWQSCRTKESSLCLMTRYFSQCTFRAVCVYVEPTHDAVGLLHCCLHSLRVCGMHTPLHSVYCLDFCFREWFDNIYCPSQ